MRKILWLLALIPIGAHAQNSFNGKWQFPTDAKSYCLNIEQNITSGFRSEIEANTRALNLKIAEDRLRIFESTAIMQKQRKEYEESWHRMECASILYGKN